MKRILAILIIAVAISGKKAVAQNYGVPDTVAYLQSIVANKALFIGKPFSILRDSLKIEIRKFNPISEISYDTRKETSTAFSFYFPQTVNDFNLSFPKLIVSWVPYLDANRSRINYNTSNGGGWSTAIADYYKTGIVSDIRVLE
jgi:hypothetical protein